MQPLKSSHERKIGITMAVGVAVLLAIAALQYRAAREGANRAYWVDHTYQVLGSLTETLRAAVWAQNAVRGYAVTGDLAVLAPRETAIAELHEGLRHLRELTVD